MVAYYHETLKQSPEALAYLESAACHPELIDHFKLGFANRTPRLSPAAEDARPAAHAGAAAEARAPARERATSTSTARW